MICRLFRTWFGALALCGAIFGCDSSGDETFVPAGGSFGGAFAGSAGKGGFISGGGSTTGGPGIAGSGTTSPCAPLGGPVDVGHIGGPGRDATSNLWTLPFATGSEPHLAVDPTGNLIVSMKFETLSIGGTFYTAYDGAETLLAKFDPEGNVRWSKTLLATLPSLASGHSANALASDAEGNIYVAGSFTGAISFGGDELSATIGPGGYFRDAFLVKLDSEGNHVWSKRFGDASDQLIYGLAVDTSGNVTVAGDFGGIVNLGGEDWISTRGSFGFDVFVAKFDAAGEHLASTAFGSERDEQVTALALAPDGNAVVFGHDGTISDAYFVGDGLFLRKFDAALSPVFEGAFPSGGVFAGGVSVDAQQNTVFVAALGNATEFQLGSPTPQGMAVVKLDAAGNALWHKSFEDLDAISPTVGTDADGNIVLSGSFNGIDFGGGQLSSAGATDAFVAKLDGTGEHLWSLRGGSCDIDRAFGLQIASDGGVFVAGTFRDTIAFSTKSVKVADSGVFLARFVP